MKPKFLLVVIPIMVLATVIGTIMTRNVKLPKKITGRIVLLKIPAGEFTMGTPGTGYDETSHDVRLSSFWIGAYEVTQEQYAEIMGKNPSSFRVNKLRGVDTSAYPVESVTWYNALRFCNALSKRCNLRPAYVIERDYHVASYEVDIPVTRVRDANGFRLPTEAEWEYACRAGTSSIYYWGNTIDDDYCWWGRNAGEKTNRVGTRKPNRWGLYDMIGNVSEWCWDSFNYDYYRTSPVDDPQGPSLDPLHVLRGGSWYDGDEDDLSSAHRDRHLSGDWFPSSGFRVVLPAESR